jgi:hypothetical protein
VVFFGAATDPIDCRLPQRLKNASRGGRELVEPKNRPVFRFRLVFAGLASLARGRKISNSPSCNCNCNCIHGWPWAGGEAAERVRVELRTLMVMEMESGSGSQRISYGLRYFRPMIITIPIAIGTGQWNIHPVLDYQGQKRLLLDGGRGRSQEM